MEQLDQIKRAERVARMKLVRAHRDGAGQAELDALFAQHAFAKVKMRIAVLLAGAPKMTAAQKREIARLL